MHALGYHILCSSDLSRLNDNSSVFFAKGQQQQVKWEPAPVLCVAPGSTDKVVLVRADDAMATSLRAALEAGWQAGIQRFEEIHTAYGKIYEFKLHGSPWTATGAESAMCRRTLLAIITQLGNMHWKFLAGVNLKGGTIVI